ncbi:MAG: hypothetical protein H7840_11705 [Alphaproteobacteria bacterium]
MTDDPRIHAALAAAVKQLEAVVKEQERAVDRIIGLVEPLMSATKHKPVLLRLEAIIEACSFQDLTGQRVRKVARLLKYLADKGDLSAAGAPPPQDDLPGPTQKGLTQEDVDRLLRGG